MTVLNSSKYCVNMRVIALVRFVPVTDWEHPL